MKCSFSKVSMKGTFKEEWPYGTDIYGRFFYMETATEKLVFAAFDFGATYPREAARWRKEVSAQTGIPEKSLWYHELQIHAAPNSEHLCGEYMDAVIERSIQTINEMKLRAEECDCFAAECDLGTEVSFNREQYVEGLGGVTVWRGIKFDENGTPYTQEPSIMLLRGYKPSLPVFEKPIYFDNPNDQMAYLFMFKNKEGKTIGTISRFAAHPDLAVLFEHSDNPERHKEYHYDYDWPGYMSDDMESEYGGISMYLNGPCGDLAVKKDCNDKGTYKTSADECKRIASLIGEKIRKIFANKAKKIDIESDFKTEMFAIDLPIKEDYPHSYKELEDLIKAVPAARKRVEDAIAANENPAVVKRLIDDLWRLEYMPLNINDPKYSFSEEELATHILTINVPAVRFGGYLFVGLPAETLVEVTLWMRSRLTGTKTIPVDQVYGHYDYMATSRSMTLGGYTYWCSWVARNAVATLKKELAPLLDEFLER